MTTSPPHPNPTSKWRWRWRWSSRTKTLMLVAVVVVVVVAAAWVPPISIVGRRIRPTAMDYGVDDDIIMISSSSSSIATVCYPISKISLSSSSSKTHSVVLVALMKLKTASLFEPPTNTIFTTIMISSFSSHPYSSSSSSSSSGMIVLASSFSTITTTTTTTTTSPHLNRKAALTMTAPSLSATSHCDDGDHSVRFRLLGGGWTWNGKKTWQSSSSSSRKKRKRSTPAPAASLISGQTSSRELRSDLYLEVLKDAREKFTQEISFWSNDRGDLSLAKALLYVAAEDEAFMAISREMDSHSLITERRDASILFKPKDWACLEAMPLAGKSISEWLTELDAIAKEVEAALVPRDIGCHLMEVMEAVNFVLFELRGFRRFPVLLDSKFSYLHTVLSSGHSSAILLSVIYIEVCRRIGVTIVGSRVGEDFLIWPQTGNPEELFKVSSGHSLFSIVNGRCVEDPSSKASDLKSKSLLGLDIATDKDIIGIALANLIRLHWKRASRMNHGLMLTSPLRPVDEANEKFRKVNDSKLPLLRPLELRLAIMASERLLILQPHNWALRRDHGMLLFYNRKYAEAVQELSICMAFAPVEEAEVLEPFVEKLHLLRIESSWKSLGHNGRLTVP
ncbi:hypothetical protein BVC80_977g9 [Macleaya cordata]|uniref:Protein SirB1 N-terminal domain-containing protein n=1 Tax=Macleaya cordata TaxID=56857 RepID=A0A200QRH8_MACCD|nr:hypothetical protein BVC80_977g9 [Macleaya cordata]